MGTNFKTSTGSADSMAKQWYAMVPSVAAIATPADYAHWDNEIQHEGSHTAWQDFVNGITKDHGPQAAQQLQTAAAAQKQQSGLDPWTPAEGAVNGQLAGTNTKNLGGALDSQKSWLQPLLEGATGLIPGIGPALAAAEGGLWNYADTHNLGNAALGAAGGYGIGSLGGMAGKALGISGGAGGAASSAIGHTGDLGDISNVGNASMSGGAGMGATSGVGFSGLGSGLADAAKDAGFGMTGGGGGGALSGLGKALGIGGGGSGATGADGGFDWSKLLAGLGGAANAYTGYQDKQNQAESRAAQLAAQQAEFNRTTADSEGMDASKLQRSVDNAPVRDRASAMLQARLGAPAQSFQPRDITHGDTGVLAGSASGGIAPTMGAMNTAAQNYTPGSGGVDTSVNKTLIQRFMNPQNTVTKIPNGATLPTGPTYTGANAYTPPPTPQVAAQPAAGGIAPPGTDDVDELLKQRLMGARMA